MERTACHPHFWAHSPCPGLIRELGQVHSGSLTPYPSPSDHGAGDGEGCGDCLFQTLTLKNTSFPALVSVHVGPSYMSSVISVIW